jgi:hypothetical protein
MIRLLAGLAVCAALAASASSAAPIPKDAGTGDATPELKPFFDAVGKAVEAERWPAETDEQLFRGTARGIFMRATKAAEQKDRKLPVEFEKLTKADVVKEYQKDRLDNGFVIAGDVKVRFASDSVIFASGKAEVTHAGNCIIIAKNVKCAGATDCLVVAGEYANVTVVQTNVKDGYTSVVVAGQWIRSVILNDAICHVIRPGKLPPPEFTPTPTNTPYPAIKNNRARNVVYLNERADTSGKDADQQTYAPPKNPIAK